MIFVGLQAAGKSTFYRERFLATHLRVNLDRLKARHREKRFLAVSVLDRLLVRIRLGNPTRERG